MSDILVVWMVLFGFTRIVAAEPVYSITAISLPTGATQGRPVGISDSGAVAGLAAPDNHSFVVGFVSSEGNAIALPFEPMGISANGKIAGGSTLWQGGDVTALPALPGDLAGAQQAYGVNNSGQVVGISFLQTDDVPEPRMVSWVNGVAMAVGMPAGYQSSVSAGINNSGVILGTADPTDSALLPDRAFVYQNGSVSLLPVPGNSFSDASAINDSGVVVGVFGAVGSEAFFPIRWSGDSMTMLTPFPGISTVPLAINNAGIIVGSAEGEFDVRSHAVMWDADLNLIDLETEIPADSGWTLVTATGINSQGQIVGYGIFDGRDEAYLLTPMGMGTTVPEPMLCDVFVLGVFGLRRQRKGVNRNEKELLEK
jgi:hypothetical protein